MCNSMELSQQPIGDEAGLFRKMAWRKLRREGIDCATRLTTFQDSPFPNLPTPCACYSHFRIFREQS